MNFKAIRNIVERKVSGEKKELSSEKMAEESKSESIVEDSTNPSLSISDESSQEGGTSLFQRLRIPFVASVIDCGSGTMVSLGNRQSSVGLANIPYHGLFVTSDEHVALESGTPSEAAWLMGFMIVTD